MVAERGGDKKEKVVVRVIYELPIKDSSYHCYAHPQIFSLRIPSRVFVGGMHVRAHRYWFILIYIYPPSNFIHLMYSGKMWNGDSSLERPKLSSTTVPTLVLLLSPPLSRIKTNL